MLILEDAQTQVDEDARFRKKGDGTKQHCDGLSTNSGEIFVRIMRHRQTTDQDRHDTRQMTQFGEHVRCVGRDE